ncbi:uncharacterized protein [Patagioenas fasciata]|uniref:uncharacterized protein n=1 Tax=Patagioenas fasciata TaxID=372321 RepID=UPI003A99F794
MAEGHQETPGTGLIPPSHFMLRPSRTLGAELAAERRRSQVLEAELEAERRRSQALEAKLVAERRRSQALEAELVAERGRSKALEAELEALRGCGQALEAELEALRGRGQAQGAELGAGQPLGQVLLQAQLSALSHILTLQERELDLEVSPPGPCPPRVGTLLGRWRQKVFVLLVQLQVQEEALRSLRGQVRALGTAVAAGTRRVTRLELQLHEGEKLRGGRQAGSAGSPGDKSHQQLGDNERLPEPGGTERLVAPEWLRWPQDLAGDNPVTQVTQPVAGGWRGAVALAGTRKQGTPRGDGTGTSRVALAALVTQLQALGAAILGDTGDTSEPP